MPKRKVVKSRKSRKSSARVYDQSDKGLMLIAAAAAVIVGFFAIFNYKSSSVVIAPTSVPSQILTVPLKAQNGSYESGTATLQEVNGKVVVSIVMTGYPSGVTQPAHIHVGSCPNPGAVRYPLTSLVNGKSTTTIDTTLTSLKSMGKLAINVHKSVAQSGVYYSCGDIKE